MEKYADSPSASRDASDYEGAALLTANYMKQESERRRNYVYLTLFNLFIFTLSMLSLICAVMSQKDTSSYSAAKLMDQFGIYSPVMHEVTYSRVKFSVPTPLNSSKYVGTTDDVETAWKEIAHLPNQQVPIADFPKLSKPPTALRVADPVTGRPGYRVGLEVFHQLHCLNLLRMSTYPEHYTELWQSDTNGEAEKVRAHLDHCVETLRMNLMCMADVNVFTFHPVEGGEGYRPDYESAHVCRNFEGIRKWAVEHAVPDQDV
ncbi:hypothetical protein BDU57DRAFT_589758 [Ampelomyces quisqualis]|uniref:Tat pathway signal sequence n=1 Tax=Ampelomyces quisqualis TaxID=50730 RepID=A0A6A5QCD0_AMPQU|nr:hypothetical protein BDU57DRAFT_589758 [Ampelomyces quisqualis]